MLDRDCQLISCFVLSVECVCVLYFHPHRNVQSVELLLFYLFNDNIISDLYCVYVLVKSFEVVAAQYKLISSRQLTMMM